MTCKTGCTELSDYHKERVASLNLFRNLLGAFMLMVFLSMIFVRYSAVFDRLCSILMASIKNGIVF